MFDNIPEYVYKYRFAPLDDITVLELALIMQAHIEGFSRIPSALNDSLPVGCIRHMILVKVNMKTGEEEDA